MCEVQEEGVGRAASFCGSAGEPAPDLSPSFGGLPAVFGDPWLVDASPTSMPSSSHGVLILLSLRPNSHFFFFLILLIFKGMVVLGCKVMSDSCDPMDCSLPGFSVHEISQA